MNIYKVETEEVVAIVIAPDLAHVVRLYHRPPQLPPVVEYIGLTAYNSGELLSVNKE